MFNIHGYYHCVVKLLKYNDVTIVFRGNKQGYYYNNFLII